VRSIWPGRITGGWIVSVIILCSLGILPLLSPKVYFLSLLYMVFLYVVLAESWNLIGGFAGYLSFGHVAFFGIGAYTTAFLMSTFHLPVASVLPISLLGGLVSAAVALVVGYPCLRLRGPYFAVITLCFAFVVQILVENLPFFGGVEGLWLTPTKETVAFQRALYYELMMGLMVVVLLVVRGIEHSRLGAGLIAIREDEDVAQCLGIPAPRIKLLAFVLSAFFPGVAGGFHACYLTYISPVIVFDVMISILIVLMTLLGGGGSWAGALLGAVSLSFVNEFLTTFVRAEIARILYGMLFIGVILFLPNGLWEFIRNASFKRAHAER